MHGLTEAQAAEVLVEIGDTKITVGEFAKRLADQSPYLRARYNSPERRKEFLDSLVRFELMAAEAKRRGYDKLPEVRRTRNQVMIQQMMKEEFEEKIKLSDVTDAEIKAHYDANKDEFHKPEQVRASHILIKNRGTAQRVLRQLLAKRTDVNLFRNLAQKHNEDTETNERFGDLRFFSRPGEAGAVEALPSEVATAAFSLKKIGDLHAELVKSDAGHHIVKLTGRRAALSRSLEEARRPIQNQLWRQKREKKVEDFVAKLRKDAKVQENLNLLSEVRINTDSPPATGAAKPPTAAPGKAPTGRVAAPGGNPVKRFIAAALFLATSGATLAASAPARAEVIEQVVAVVNDEALFLSELRRRAVPFLERVMNAPTETERVALLEELYAQILDRLIDDSLIQQAARKADVRITSADIDRAIENVRRQSGLTEAQFWDAIRGQGFTEAQYRGDVRRQLLRLRLLNERVRTRVNITEEDVRQAYEKEHGSAGSTLRFRASHVFLKLPEGGNATAMAAIRQQAEATRGHLTADNFADTAQQLGGGELGWLQQEDLPKELERSPDEARTGRDQPAGARPQRLSHSDPARARAGDLGRASLCRRQGPNPSGHDGARNAPARNAIPQRTTPAGRDSPPAPQANRAALARSVISSADQPLQNRPQILCVEGLRQCGALHGLQKRPQLGRQRTACDES